MERKKLNIGLFGFGCVGYGLYQVLQKTPKLNANIKTICVKNPNKQRELPAENFIYDKNIILNDDSINVVVELIDDADAAFEIVKTALKSKKAVVTANKKMIAEHFEELLALQRTYEVPLLYEASVCASIPIIRNLEEYYNNDLLESIEGIVNGSTNYILSKTSLENISYQDALADAQAKGYAESNPILDTGGFDAKYKLLILLAHSFGIILKPEHIYNIGIDKISDLELNYAKEKGFKIKLIAQAFKNKDETITAFVAPKFIAQHDKLYQVDDVFNGVVLQTAFAENQFFVGKGAGAYPTASAVLSDISALTYDYKYEYKKIDNAVENAFSNEFNIELLLKAKNDDLDVIKNYFSKVNETYKNSEDGYIIGNIEFSTLKEINALFQVSVVIFKVNKDINKQSKIEVSTEIELNI
jgi:homoserine dehydrogenase